MSRYLRITQDYWSQRLNATTAYKKRDNRNMESASLIGILGSDKQEHDGFIEIRDDRCNVVSKKVDTTLEKSFTQMLTKAFGADLDAAWTALEPNLPVELQDLSTLTFNTDQLDNILIFSDAGAMICQINYWSHTDQHDRSWDDEYLSESNYNSNFHFPAIET